MGPAKKPSADDWLDNEGASNRGREPKRVKKGLKPPDGEDAYLDAAQTNATVVEVFPGQAAVRLDTGGERVLCGYRRARVRRTQAGSGVRERNWVTVGDRVRAAPERVILGIAERRNRLSRASPGSETGARIQVVAANLDIVVICASARDPEFSVGLADRYFVSAHAAGIPALVAVNKCDLLEPGAPRPWASYPDSLELSVRDGRGLEALRSRVEGKVALFCGQSGVGKTSLLTRLLGASAGRVGALSASTGRGQHTTTSAIALDAPGGGLWIDTPGVREFALSEIDLDEIRAAYPEWMGHACAARECWHDRPGDPDCAVQADPEALTRWRSYLRLLEDRRSHDGGAGG